MVSKKRERIIVSFEFPIKCSPSLLYNYISSATGLADWFADNVITKSRTEYIFKFEDGEEQKAILLKSIPNKMVRFKWENTPENEYLDIEIIQDELTDDVAIKITEFCWDDEKREFEELWHSEIDQLKQAIGG